MPAVSSLHMLLFLNRVVSKLDLVYNRGHMCSDKVPHASKCAALALIVVILL